MGEHINEGEDKYRKTKTKIIIKTHTHTPHKKTRTKLQNITMGSKENTKTFD